jgi:catechol 2,3-dioxygenase-like lactoylglutathione lyase family enzyme
MLSQARIDAALPASDLDRARRFYEEKLGLTPARELESGLVYEGAGGTRFLLFPSHGAPSGDHTQIGFTVEDFDATIAELRSRGVVFEEYDLPGLQTVEGIAELGEIRSAWIKDSEGNLLAIANEMG